MIVVFVVAATNLVVFEGCSMKNTFFRPLWSFDPAPSHSIYIQSIVVITITAPSLI
jgi:hypothetical protein